MDKIDWTMIPLTDEELECVRVCVANAPIPYDITKKKIPGAYDVVISSKLLSEFTNKQYNLKYFIALEPDSTFG